MTLFNRTRPTYKNTNPNLIMSALTCPDCTYRDPDNPVKARDTYIRFGSLGRDLHWTCAHCRHDVHVPVDLERFGALSDAFVRIQLLDDELQDPHRRNVGARVDPRILTQLVDAALSGYGLTEEPESVREWCGSHHKGVLRENL
jgi:hypothetical protein